MKDAVQRDRKNLMILGRRVTISVERAVWNALVEICRREELSLDELCEAVAKRRLAVSLASGLRMTVLFYFRALTGDGRKPADPLDLALSRLAEEPVAKGAAA
jgi:predicted DNA-binding ribbon-helix-helix protein